jgi:hypothetical protein
VRELVHAGSPVLGGVAFAEREDTQLRAPVAVDAAVRDDPLPAVGPRNPGFDTPAEIGPVGHL